MAYSDEILADSPTVYYELDESSGTTVSDSSGNGNAGTVSGTYSWGATGLITSGTALDLTNGIVDFGTILSAKSTLTVEFWFNADDVTTRQVLFEAGAHAVGTVIYLDAGSLYALNTQSSGTADNKYISTAVSTGTTYHVVVVVDGSTSIELFLDAVSQGSETISGNATGSDGGAIGGMDATPSSGNAAFHDGDVAVSAGDYPFNGRIDEFAGYLTALSSTRVQAHYDEGTGGGTTISGTGAVTDSGETVSASGAVTVSGTGAVTDAGEAVASTGAVSVSGTGSLTDAGETISGTSASVRTGTGSLTDGQETISGAGAATVSGSGSIQDSGETISATGETLISGSASVTESGEVVDAAGAVLISGSGSLTDSGETIAGFQTVNILATLDASLSDVFTLECTLTDAFTLETTLTD